MVTSPSISSLRSSEWNLASFLLGVVSKNLAFNHRPSFAANVLLLTITSKHRRTQRCGDHANWQLCGSYARRATISASSNALAPASAQREVIRDDRLNHTAGEYVGSPTNKADSTRQRHTDANHPAGPATSTLRQNHRGKPSCRAEIRQVLTYSSAWTDNRSTTTRGQCHHQPALPPVYAAKTTHHQYIS